MMNRAWVLYAVRPLIATLALVACIAPPANALNQQAIDQALRQGEIRLVTPTNKSACVEYFTLKGQSYCSFKPVAALTDPLAGAVKHERLSLSFDSAQKWRLGWFNDDTRKPMLEYLPVGQSIDAWRELVTTQFFPDSTTVSPKQFSAGMMAQLKKQGFTPNVTVYQDQPDDFLYQFKISGTAAQDQQVLHRLIRRAEGMYSIQYAAKPTLPADKQAAWIKRLLQATVK